MAQHHFASVEPDSIREQQQPHTPITQSKKGSQVNLLGIVRCIAHGGQSDGLHRGRRVEMYAERVRLLG